MFVQSCIQRNRSHTVSTSNSIKPIRGAAQTLILKSNNEQRYRQREQVSSGANTVSTARQPGEGDGGGGCALGGVDTCKVNDFEVLRRARKSLSTATLSAPTDASAPPVTAAKTTRRLSKQASFYEDPEEQVELRKRADCQVTKRQRTLPNFDSPNFRCTSSHSSNKSFSSSSLSSAQHSHYKQLQSQVQVKRKANGVPTIKKSADKLAQFLLKRDKRFLDNILAGPLLVGQYLTRSLHQVLPSVTWRLTGSRGNLRFVSAFCFSFISYQLETLRLLAESATSTATCTINQPKNSGLNSNQRAPQVCSGATEHSSEGSSHLAGRHREFNVREEEEQLIRPPIVPRRTPQQPTIRHSATMPTFFGQVYEQQPVEGYFDRFTGEPTFYNTPPPRLPPPPPPLPGRYGGQVEQVSARVVFAQPELVGRGQYPNQQLPVTQPKFFNQSEHPPQEGGPRGGALNGSRYTFSERRVVQRQLQRASTFYTAPIVPGNLHETAACYSSESLSTCSSNQQLSGFANLNQIGGGRGLSFDEPTAINQYHQHNHQHHHHLQSWHQQQQQQHHHHHHSVNKPGTGISIGGATLERRKSQVCVGQVFDVPGGGLDSSVIRTLQLTDDGSDEPGGSMSEQRRQPVIKSLSDKETSSGNQMKRVHQSEHNLNLNNNSELQPGGKVDLSASPTATATSTQSSKLQVNAERIKPKRSASPSKLSLAGARRRLWQRQKGLSSLSVQRSEEVAPLEARHLVRQSTTSSMYDSKVAVRWASLWTPLLTTCPSWIDSLRNPELYMPDARCTFVEGLGVGQVASRQALVSPHLGDIQVGLCDQRGLLEVEIVRARCLHKKVSSKFQNALPSPFVKLYLMRDHHCIAKFKTQSARQTLDPLYQEKFLFRGDYSACVLQIIVWGDYGRGDRKSLMGIAQIQLSELDLSNLVLSWYKLLNTPSMADSLTSSRASQRSAISKSGTA